MKKVIVISCDLKAGQFHANELQILFEKRIEVKALDVNSIQRKGILKADLYCITTDALEQLPNFYKQINSDIPIVIMHVTFSKKNLQQISFIPENEKVLLVNLNEPMAQEAITKLIQLGINHINFIPYFPGCNLKITEEMRYAITPDERRFVPQNIPNVIDVGQRRMDNETLVEIALKLKMYDLWEDKKWKRHFAEITSNSYNFDELFGRALRLESGFQSVIDIMDIGILGINELGNIFIHNKKAEEILKRSISSIMSQDANKIFPFLPLEEVKKTLKKIDARLIKINENLVTIGIYPMNHNQKNIGFLVMLQYFKEEEEKQHRIRTQLLNKGHTAKYTFDDILGTSDAIEKIKKIAEKMAKTKASILITGESGTGKELFAQAIHNASDRKNKPFIALNCAALPESLLESELFGYVDGAFTGAKKGGKLGFFEFAHQGTLFLDEVEGMTPMLQVKLLRVIQEQEVMRLGDNRLISIDVRIIAATNRNLEELMTKGEFREDLYYRLSTLPIELPPLRERTEDIFPLIDKFSKENGASFILSDEVKKIFENHYWHGNIRELKNCIDYFYFLDKRIIECEDLPPSFLKKIQKKEKNFSNEILEFENIALDQKEKYLFILKIIMENNKKEIPIGREELAKIGRSQNIKFSIYEIRNILSKLNKDGYIKTRRGCFGNKITEKGKNIVKNIKQL